VCSGTWQAHCTGDYTTTREEELWCAGAAGILRQRLVALSSCEAEYTTVAAAAACEAVWLAHLLAELIGGAVLAPRLLVDNKSAIALMKNPVHHDRSKHINVKFHFIRECCDRKLIHVEFVGTELQLGDILTKALGRIRFQELRSMIGMKKIE